MLFDIHKLQRTQIFQELRTLFTLTCPLLAAQCMQVFVGFIEILMVGSLGTDETAALSIGSTIFFTVWVMLLGMSTSVSALVARQYGQYGARHPVGKMGQQGLWFSLFLSIIGTSLLVIIIYLLNRYLAMPRHILNKTCLFIQVIAIGMPASMLYCVACEYTASLLRTKIIMLINLCGLLINILLDYLFIHGLLGAPQMGASGCGIGRAITYWLNAVLLLFYIYKNAYYKPFGLFKEFAKPNLKMLYNFLKIGAFSGLSYLLEMCLIATIILIGANFGAAYVVSQNIIINFCSILYMVPQSFSIVLAIRISESIGKNQLQYARSLCGIGSLIGMAIAIGASVLIWPMRHIIMDLYSDDRLVMAIGAPLLIMGCFFYLFNTMQAIASGALRGYKKTKGTLLIHIATFVGIGIPLAYFFALSKEHLELFGYQIPIGFYGAWIGIITSLFAASVWLFGYLTFISQQKEID
jgi:MATE family multidrug resistance protein